MQYNEFVLSQQTMLSEETLTNLRIHREKALSVIYDINQLGLIFKNVYSPPKHGRIIIAGSTYNRVVFLSIDKQQVLICLHTPLHHYKRYTIFQDISLLHSFDQHIHLIETSKEIIGKLTSPRIQLVSLSHTDIFLSPRFALGISDIAETIRSQFGGIVNLADMQLGDRVDYIVKNMNQYDIVGVSITFGQLDIFEKIINKFSRVRKKILLIVGGSLASLNYRSLLDMYPKIIVCMGMGEQTMIDIVRYWRNEIKISDVCNIAYKDSANQLKQTHREENTRSPVTPALDLLGKTLSSKGVFQLETSRGCTNTCSFCPRRHKGRWVGYTPFFLEKMMPHITSIYAQYPEIDKKIFFVDEECIGHKTHANLKRMREIAKILSDHNFTFETSSRIDQVYRDDKNKTWNVERVKFWKYLVKNGLERVLFGLESGVDSILKRFNKGITKKQNEFAIRVLSACNIPFRFTYITFDPLMTVNELVETYLFQGRNDLLLQPLLQFSDNELLKLINNESGLNYFYRGEPLYRNISYLMVSMECLSGSPYLQLAEQEGIVKNTVLSMGKKKVEYLQYEIGVISHLSQLWIDRNFTLDYLLKSLIKITSPENRSPYYDMRIIIKDASYDLLGKLLYVISRDQKTISHLSLDATDSMKLDKLAAKWKDQLLGVEPDKLPLMDLLDSHFLQLHAKFIKSFDSYNSRLVRTDVVAIEKAIQCWSNQNSWNLINNT